MPSQIFYLREQLEEKISNSIESVYAKREEDFKKSSKENIENIIEPFKKRIKEFEEEVRKNTSQQHEFHTKTKLTIDNLIEQTNQITSDANKLTKALSGDSKTQGDYGELKLEMLLEGSGLEENARGQGRSGQSLGRRCHRLRGDRLILTPIRMSAAQPRQSTPSLGDYIQ